MGSKDKFFGLAVAQHGFDDIGAAQPSGSISGATNGISSGPRYAGKLRLTVDTTAMLKKGQAIRLSSNGTGHSGPTRILGILGATAMVVNTTFDNTVEKATGVWSVDGGAGAWDGFMPIGANMSAADLTVTFWDPAAQGSDENAVDYIHGKVYPFPGVIKTIRAASGNLRLYRSATLRPGGRTAQ